MEVQYCRFIYIYIVLYICDIIYMYIINKYILYTCEYIYISTPYCMCGIETDYGCGAGWLLSIFVDIFASSIHRKGWKKARGWWIFPVVNGVKNRATHDHIL